MKIDTLKNEINILKAIYEWERDKTLDLGFCELLTEAREMIVEQYGRFNVQAPGFVIQTHIDWDCPICNTTNTYIGNQEDINFYDGCKNCKLETEIFPE